MSGGTLSRAQRRAASAEGKRRAEVERRIRRLEALFRAEAADPSMLAAYTPGNAEELASLWLERASWHAPVVGEQLTLGSLA